MGTFFLMMVVALVFWGLGWHNAETYRKRKYPDLSLENVLKDRILEMQAEIVTLKAQNKTKGV